MDWQGIASIVGVIAGLSAILALVYNLGKMNAKIEILWDAYKEEARSNTKRDGTMEMSSQWRLTEKGKEMIPPELKAEIKSLLGRRRGIQGLFKKLNPNKMRTWDIIGKLGGISRLSREAEKAGIPLSEFIVMVETYIQCHLGE